MILHPITVDQQEKDPDADSQAADLKRLGGQALVGDLKVGDYRWVLEPEDPEAAWWEVIGERKSGKDFAASLEDGRLARFVEETGGLDPPPNQIRFLLLEGPLTQVVAHGPYRTMEPETLDNLLVSLQQWGVLTLRSQSSAHTPHRLLAFWHYTSKKEHLSIVRPHQAVASAAYLYGEDRKAVEALMGWPGVGEERAKAILKHYGSIAEAIAALKDPAAFARPVKGVGTGIATGIKEFLMRKVEI